jgi:UDP-sugar transporter A1/2/3
VASPAFNVCQQQQQQQEAGDKEQEVPVDFYQKSIGYIMTVVSVLLSGFVSIYFEKVVKSKTEVITIWERNFQLCFYSIVFCIMMNMYTTAQHSVASEPYIPLSNWSGLTVVVAVLGAGNGLIVVMFLFYMLY